MKTRFSVLLLLILLGIGYVSAQNVLNYMPKTLVNELGKEGVSGDSMIVEIEPPYSTLPANQINGKYFFIKDNRASHFKYIYVGRVYSCRAGGCSISNNTRNEIKSEYFDYYILYDKNKSVQAIRIFNYQASHGNEITAKGWLKQFIGYNGSESLQVDKNVDAISGATISVYAITSDVEIKTALLKTLRQ